MAKKGSSVQDTAKSNRPIKDEHVQTQLKNLGLDTALPWAEAAKILNSKALEEQLYQEEFAQNVRVASEIAEEQTRPHAETLAKIRRYRSVIEAHLPEFSVGRAWRMPQADQPLPIVLCQALSEFHAWCCKEAYQSPNRIQTHLLALRALFSSAEIFHKAELIAEKLKAHLDYDGAANKCALKDDQVLPGNVLQQINIFIQQVADTNTDHEVLNQATTALVDRLYAEKRGALNYFATATTGEELYFLVYPIYSQPLATTLGHPPLSVQIKADIDAVPGDSSNLLTCSLELIAQALPRLMRSEFLHPPQLDAPKKMYLPSAAHPKPSHDVDLRASVLPGAEAAQPVPMSIDSEDGDSSSVPPPPIPDLGGGGSGVKTIPTPPPPPPSTQREGGAPVKLKKVGSDQKKPLQKQGASGINAADLMVQSEKARLKREKNAQLEAKAQIARADAVAEKQGERWHGLHAQLLGKTEDKREQLEVEAARVALLVSEQSAKKSAGSSGMPSQHPVNPLAKVNFAAAKILLDAKAKQKREDAQRQQAEEQADRQAKVAEKEGGSWQGLHAELLVNTKKKRKQLEVDAARVALHISEDSAKKKMSVSSDVSEHHPAAGAQQSNALGQIDFASAHLVLKANAAEKRKEAEKIKRQKEHQKRAEMNKGAQKGLLCHDLFADLIEKQGNIKSELDSAAKERQVRIELHLQETDDNRQIRLMLERQKKQQVSYSDSDEEDAGWSDEEGMQVDLTPSNSDEADAELDGVTKKMKKCSL